MNYSCPHFEKFDRFIEELNSNKVKYVIIRGYWQLPVTPDTDLDVVFHPDSYDKMLSIIEKYWDRNLRDCPQPRTLELKGKMCQYIQWWTTAPFDDRIHNKRFTMDTYNRFFFNQHILSDSFIEDIFSNGLEERSNYYVLKPLYEVLLLGYRNVFEINPDAFKEKHVNVIKSLISKNNINDVNAFNQAMSSFTNLDQNAAYVVEKIKQALS